MVKAIGSIFVIAILLVPSGCRTIKNSFSSSGYLFATKSTDQYPFQVLHAEGSRRIGSDSLLNRFDYVSADDFLKVNNGHMILVHYSGKFLEFDQDTIFSVSEINEHLKDYLHLSDGAKKYRPDLEMLFSYRISYSGGSCSPPHLEIVGKSEPMDFRRDNICISWKVYDTEKHAPYEVEVKNIFDQVVVTYETETNSIQLDLTPYDSALEVGLAIVQVFSKQDREISSYPIGIRLVDKCGYTPSPCCINSAIDAIEVGSYLRWYGEDFGKYFDLAAVMSDRPIYQELQQWTLRTF